MVCESPFMRPETIRNGFVGRTNKRRNINWVKSMVLFCGAGEVVIAVDGCVGYVDASICVVRCATETWTIPITMGNNRNQSTSHRTAHIVASEENTRIALINSIYRRKCVTEIHCEGLILFVCAVFGGLSTCWRFKLSHACVAKHK